MDTAVIRQTSHKATVPKAPPLMNSVQGAAARLGISPSKLYVLIAEGVIEARKLCGRTVVPEESLQAFAAGLPDAEIAVRARARAAAKASAAA